ncbi:hypothetical protein GDO81_019573 [Engystomops pustulosus]|uniref:Uncharacterized protein n=1 Tax=Engystomops pustulosus TaxID=76066 RepID=A0AAV6YU93_ENGPU|nr:hypothetical protein GDO81_019573 [Engystomops pustulosus]
MQCHAYGIKQEKTTLVINPQAPRGPAIFLSVPRGGKAVGPLGFVSISIVKPSELSGPLWTVGLLQLGLHFSRPHSSCLCCLYNMCTEASIENNYVYGNFNTLHILI